MRFIDMIGDIQSRVGSTDTELVTIIKRKINDILSDIETRFPDAWWLRVNDLFPTVAKMTDGTAVFTSGSKTVTKDAGSEFWTTRMVGRVVQNDTDAHRYRIERWISDTEIRLNFPYQGTTESGASYSIGIMEYDLPPDCKKVLHLKQFQRPTKLTAVSKDDFFRYTGDPMIRGFFAEPVAWWNEDPVRIPIEEVTITDLAQGARTATVSGSVLQRDGYDIDGLGIQLVTDAETERYRVGDVLTNTTLDLQEPYRGATISSGSVTAKISIPGTKRVAVYPIPDAKYVLEAHYTRNMPRLVADADIPVLPQELHPVIVGGATARVLRDLGDKQEADAEDSLYEGRGIQQIRAHATDEDEDKIDVMERRTDYHNLGENTPLFTLPGNYDRLGSWL